MGNNICQCKIICQNLKEADLSSNKSSKKSRSKKNKINNNTNNDLLKKNKEIEKIYKNNCVKKIAKAYLAYKKRKNNNIENSSNGMPYNQKKEELNNYNNIQNGANNNFIEYSMNHPFYVDKVHCTKTNYEKIDIPKINNGKSLEILLNKDSNDNNRKHKKK